MILASSAQNHRDRFQKSSAQPGHFPNGKRHLLAPVLARFSRIAMGSSRYPEGPFPRYEA